MEIINAGVPGDTTARALDRLAEILELQPRIVMITLGGNDLKNGVRREVAFENLEEIVRRFQDNGALVVIGGLNLPFWGRGFGDAYEELAEKTGSVLVPNIYQDILGKPGLMSDRIHPNREGYGVMAQHFYKALRPYL
jgi:lysophospholipase L1-like esterase